MKVITRKEAKKNGLKRYFTGKTCKNGHIAERFVCNCECVECEKERKNRKNVNSVKTKIEVVDVSKRQVRIVRFKVVGRDRRFLGKKKYNHVILEDKVVNVG